MKCEECGQEYNTAGGVYPKNYGESHALPEHKCPPVCVVAREKIEAFYHWQDKECPALEHFADEMTALITRAGGRVVTKEDVQAVLGGHGAFTPELTADLTALFAEETKGNG